MTQTCPRASSKTFSRWIKILGLASSLTLTSCSDLIPAECQDKTDGIVMAGHGIISNGVLTGYSVQDPNGLSVSVDRDNSRWYTCRIVKENEHG